MEEEQAVLLRKTRLMLGLTTEEAGRLVGVTRRAWEHWEGGSRKVTSAAFELFMAKAAGWVPSSIDENRERGLVVIVSEDGQQVIDVVSSDNFLSWEPGPRPGTAVIHSFAIERFTGKRYKHSVTFSTEVNTKVLQACERWKAADQDA
ncbi:helix-turn-helix transcriptional regulator [Pseudomonas syringae]|nr:helix-turn-helix transcriptional regulator [Pseudomonas syringae]MBD8802393.1 helix-turn-helix transcriptional regulator [Pseudomonas syringae]MBD8813113.1 helix-turn-helix transcriptional regulator [Pseudomonas syringae]